MAEKNQDKIEAPMTPPLPNAAASVSAPQPAYITREEAIEISKRQVEGVVEISKRQVEGVVEISKRQVEEAIQHLCKRLGVVL